MKAHEPKGDRLMVGNSGPSRDGARRGVVRWAVALTLTALAARPGPAQENSDCLACHGEKGFTGERKGRTVSLYVGEKAVTGSIHGRLQCVSCHASLEGKELPHEAPLPKVDLKNNFIVKETIKGYIFEKVLEEWSENLYAVVYLVKRRKLVLKETLIGINYLKKYEKLKKLFLKLINAGFDRSIRKILIRDISISVQEIERPTLAFGETIKLGYEDNQASKR